MRIFWTSAAIEDVGNITDYISQESPTTAAKLIERIQLAPEILRQFPYSGRSGRKNGTRELVITSLPYVIVYQVAGEQIRLLRVLHGAQRWP